MQINDISLILFFGAVAAGSVVLSWLYYFARRRSVRAPELHTRVRLRTGASVFVSYFLAEESGGWRVSAPILQSDIVPLRPSARFIADYSAPNGIAVFFTRVVGRSPDETLLLQKPSKIELRERRDHKRIAFVREHFVQLDGKRATLRDFGEGGARLRLDTAVESGDEVTLCVAESVFRGFVMSCKPISADRGFVVRLRFLEETKPEQLHLISAALVG